MSLDHKSRPDVEAGTGPGRAVRWVRDLGIGVRLVTRGGRSTWTRMALTAVGVGLGVGMLLLAASAPAILDARHARNNARVYIPAEHRTAHSVLMRDAATDYRDISVSGFMIESESAHPVVPPGLTRVPAPGELVVSPKLLDLLNSPDGTLLRRRIPYQHITGTIADSGLGGPNEYWYYLGSDTLDGDNPVAFHVARFGTQRGRSGLDATLSVILLVGISVLLIPVAVFIGAAVRFGAESRDRQQAALRLVGADRQMTRRIAAGEALIGAILGLIVGTAIFLAGRQLVELVTFDGISAFSSDVRPSPVLALLIVLGLPAAAVVVTIVALRRVVAEPLGVVRQAAARTRRLWWRLLTLVIGLAALLPLMRGIPNTGSSLVDIELTGGVVLLLFGVAALLPWGVEALVRRLRGGSVAWQLAVRRLQLDSGSAARAVSGITVAVAGAIALQTLFAGIQHTYVAAGPRDQNPHRDQLIVQNEGAVDSTRAEQMAARFRSTPGVRSVRTLADATLTVSGREPRTDQPASILVGSCAALRGVAILGRCVASPFSGAARTATHSR